MKDRPGQYVRDHYGVPAFIGRRVRYTGRLGASAREGKIAGFDGQYLLVKFDDDDSERHGFRERLHPTWEMEYL